MLLVIARAVHIGACMILLSLFAFEILVARPALRETDRSASPQMEVLREQFRLLAVWSGFAAIVSGIVWFWIVLARMTGGSLWEMPSIDSIGVTITQTQFGQLWTWRLGLMFLFTIANLFARPKCRAFVWSSRAWHYAGAIIATTLLGSLAWAGHAGATIGAERPIHLTADTAHLIAAGLWPGGLLPLTLLLVRASRSDHASLLLDAGAITRRFSAVSLLVVGALAATGLTNSYFLVGSLPALVTTTYGRLLLMKLFLFSIMIGFGACNRLRLKPQLALANEQNANQPDALRKLMRNVIAELCIGTLIVLVVGALGATPPPRHGM
ncbi:MAG: copper homeostasis membrane protein CopD [Candidatus Udaeobacter sp.]